jgi:hypothetical protein
MRGAIAAMFVMLLGRRLVEVLMLFAIIFFSFSRRGRAAGTSNQAAATALDKHSEEVHEARRAASVASFAFAFTSSFTSSFSAAFPSSFASTALRLLLPHDCHELLQQRIAIHRLLLFLLLLRRRLLRLCLLLQARLLIRLFLAI